MADVSAAGTHADAHHPSHLAHHFDTPTQQFDSSKLGMWLFLATELLLFGGLFCAYAVYRANHPEIFVYAHHYLDTTLGATNTVILLFSSLTMAWAVRASQLGQRRLLLGLLGVTLLCGFGFMGIKYVEYKSKWEHGLLWAASYDPHGKAHDGEEHSGGAEPAEAAAPAGGAAESAPRVGDLVLERTTIGSAARGPSGLAAEEGGDKGARGAPADVPSNVQVFFSIYFMMTGLHGLHVIAGMAAILWVLLRAFRGDFSGGYFTPVELTGLYWHLVDLIWIFLFPLLYLIH